jgi:hypothetical protein
MDLCVSTDRAIEPNDIGVMSKVIPGGRCALLRHVGPEETLDAAIRHLYAQMRSGCPRAVKRYATTRSFCSVFHSFRMFRSTKPSPIFFSPCVSIDEGLSPPDIKSAPASLP